MSRCHRFVLVLFVTLALVAAAGAEEAARPSVETTDLGAGLFLLGGIGGNVLVHVGAHDVLLVDSGYPGLTDLLQEALAEITQLPVRLLVNTHWHFDHTGGNETLAATGATVIAHSRVRTHQSSAQLIAILDREVEAMPPLARPSITFADGLTVHHGDATVELLHLANAHSDGDTVVRFPAANVIHTGDIVFNCGYPFIDVNHGGTIDGVIAAVETILGMCDEETRIVPGHGPLASPEDLRTYHGMLSAFRDVVAQEVAAGRDLEEIRSGGATADLDQRWGKVYFPPAPFTEMVIRTLPD